ncbi:MAG: hypothetical protein RIR97_1978 [Pseudomonadota bacterium]|jgi:hypothetical protein
MNKMIATAGLVTGLFLATAAQSREVTLTTKMKTYSGNNAYVVIYVSDAAGKVQETLWMAGGKSRYYSHLTNWNAASGSQSVDGITGASVGSGRSLTVKVDIADALIDAGYQIRLDSAVEDMTEKPSDVVVPLVSAGSGQAAAGRGYVKSFQFDM